jgi:hypothetical protein
LKRLRTILGGLGLLVALLFAAVPVYASPNNCTWTGATSTNWNTSTNWSGCGSVVPQNGDNLIFNKSSLSGPTNLTNNISSLQVGSVQFSGSNSFGFIIGGNSITIAGGISDTSSGSSDTLGVGITLSASQTFSAASGSLLSIANGGSLTVGANTLAISGGRVDFDGPIIGTGTLNFNTSYTANFLDYNSPSFSGPININGGRVIINAAETTPLGTGPLTITNGAVLQQSVNSLGTYTIANPITMVGDGGGGNGAINIHDFSGGSASTVNFTGAITLTGNTFIDLNGDNADFVSHPSGCGYSIAQSSGGSLSGNLTGACTVASGSGTSGITNTTTTSADPAAAPATGYGQPSSYRDVTILIVLSLITLCLGLRLSNKNYSQN